MGGKVTAKSIYVAATTTRDNLRRVAIITTVVKISRTISCYCSNAWEVRQRKATTITRFLE